MTPTQPGSNVMEPEVSTSSRNPLLRISVAVIVVLVLLAIGIVPRVLRNREARDVVHASTVLLPEVIVVHPQQAPVHTSLSLPGNLEPLYSASVFARTNGYVEKRFVDIGSHVKAGQTLAIISTPETDQQLNQARADVLQAAAALEQSQAALQQAQANLDLAPASPKIAMPTSSETMPSLSSPLTRPARRSTRAMQMSPPQMQTSQPRRQISSQNKPTLQGWNSCRALSTSSRPLMV